MSNAAGEWAITPDERTRYDSQFKQLNPAAGFISGNDARGFFLKSGLPPMVLGQIWELSDINKDGKLDAKEFSIAMHFIQAKLKGHDLPAVLPESLKVDPSSNGSSNQSVPNSMVMPSQPSMYGTVPSMRPQMQPNAFDGFGTFNLSQSSFSGTMPRAQPPMYGPVSSPPMASTYAAVPLRPAMPTPSYGTVQTSSLASTVVTPSPYGATGALVGGIPPNQCVKYAQLMTTYDVQKKGYLTGVEARAVLMQSGLATNLLAQIWNLSDVDRDGNLNQHEFCIAMFLVETARTGQPLPAQLPPAMLTAQVAQPVPPAPIVPIALSGSIDLATMSEQDAKSFEDRRQENFKKGEAELERRRQLLQEQLKAEEDARLAAERAEAERREQQRQEAERKRQEELQKQRERQEQIERERQEQRNKAIEQREAARLQLERQRHAEWERQRREQLVQEKQRERSQLELRRARITDLKFEVSSTSGKKTELGEKVARLKENIAMVTAAIDAMKQSRDAKIQGIEGMKGDYMEANAEYSKVHAEREQLNSRYQQMTLNDPIADEMNLLRQQLSQRQSALDRLRLEADQISESREDRQEALQKARTRTEDVNTRLSSAESGADSARQAVSERRARYRSKKNIPKQQSLHNGWEGSSATTGLSAAFGSISLGSNSISTPALAADPFATAFPTPATNKQSTPADKWDAFASPTTPTVADTTKTNGAVAFSDPFDTSGGNDVFDTSNGWASSTNHTNGLSMNHTNGNGIHNAFDAFAPSATEKAAIYQNFTTAPQSSSKSTASLYRVIYNFTARNEDELNLQEGDIINVPADQSSAEPGWIYGEIDGRMGMVPENYIQRLTAAEQDAFSPSVLPASTHQAPVTQQSFGETVPSVVKQPSLPQSGAEFCMALYNYEQQEEGDLTFVQGDIIQILSKDGEWYTGQLNGRQGLFPATFVKPLDPESDDPPAFSPPAVSTNNSADGQAASYGEDAEVGAVMTQQPSKPTSLISSNQGTDTDRLRAELETKLAASNQPPAKSGKQGGSKKPEIVTVIADYRATGSEQLSLEPGNLIYIKKKSDSGWWQGELHARGKSRQVGWFPANYVRPWTGGTGGSRQSSRTTPVSDIEAEREKVITLYAYTANHNDELTFRADEIINVINKDDPDWWKGELNGINGLFPSNYVKPVMQTSLQPKPFFDEAKTRLSPLVGNNFNLNASHSLTASRPADSQHVSWSPELQLKMNIIPNSNDIKSNTHSPLSPAFEKGEDSEERLRRKRNAAINEFVKSEEDYCQDLNTAIEMFAQPLTLGGAMSEDEMKRIFINWDELISCSTGMLKSIKVRQEMAGDDETFRGIADLISAHIPHFTPYIRYCAAHQNASKELQRLSESEKFKLVHTACMRDSRSGGMPMSSFLLKPVQRVAKYHLLIKKIIDYTSQDHFDFDDLQEAHAKALDLVDQVNMGVEQRENSQRLEWLQGHVEVIVPGTCEKLTFNSLTNCAGPRRLLFHGSLAKAKSPSKLLWCFLFNDILLITKLAKGSLTDSLVFSNDPRIRDVKLRVHGQPYLLDSISAKSIDNNTSKGVSTEDQTDLAIFLKDNNNAVRPLYVLRGRTGVERNNWEKHINEAVGEFLEHQNKSRVKRSMSSYKTNVVGRVRLHVDRAKDLMSGRSGKGKPDAFCLATLGEQEQRTRVIVSNCNPEWNEAAEFFLKHIDSDILRVTVYDRDYFSPNSFLGEAQIRIKELVEERNSRRPSAARKLLGLKKSNHAPLVKRLKLLQGPGEKSAVILKIDVQVFMRNAPPPSPSAKLKNLHKLDNSMGLSVSTSQNDLTSRRVQSGYVRRTSYTSRPIEDNALQRRALSTVALDAWGD